MFIFIEGEGARYQTLIDAAKKKLGKFDFYGEEMDYKVLYQAEKLGPAGVPTPECFKKIPQTEIGLSVYCNYSKEGIDLLPNLKLISTSRGGMEHVDIDYATSKGIVVTHCPGHNAATVSQHAVSLLIGENDNIARGHMAVINDNWKAKYPNSADWRLFAGSRCGIVGYGNIGRKTAHTLSGFDMEMVAYDPFVTAEAMAAEGVKKVELDELFKTCDYIIVHARLLPETMHMIDKKLIDSMKPTAYIVNNARSGLIDYDALYDALKEHRIMGAGLDVFDVEPLPADDRFCKLDNVTLSPHCHAGGPSANIFTCEYACDGVIAALNLDKSSRQIVNKEVLDNPEFIAWAKKAKAEMGL